MQCSEVHGSTGPRAHSLGLGPLVEAAVGVRRQLAASILGDQLWVWVMVVCSNQCHGVHTHTYICACACVCVWTITKLESHSNHISHTHALSSLARSLITRARALNRERERARGGKVKKQTSPELFRTIRAGMPRTENAAPALERSACLAVM